MSSSKVTERGEITPQVNNGRGDRSQLRAHHGTSGCGRAVAKTTC